MPKERPPKVPLPPDPDGQNDDRARSADGAIREYINITRTDREYAAADLIADIGHWCDRNGLDFRKQIERGVSFYEQETDGDMEPVSCPECARSHGPNYTGPCEH